MFHQDGQELCLVRSYYDEQYTPFKILNTICLYSINFISRRASIFTKVLITKKLLYLTYRDSQICSTFTLAVRKKISSFFILTQSLSPQVH